MTIADTFPLAEAATAQRARVSGHGPGKLVLVCIVMAACMPRLVMGTENGQPAKCNLKIASQPLGAALQQYASQCAVQIVFFSQVAEGLQARALNGSFSPSEALPILLAESHLTFRVINPKTIEIVPLTSTVAANKASGGVQDRRREADFHGAHDPNQGNPPEKAASVNEIVVNGTAEGLVATRTETPLREIPQSLSIISSEQIRQENYVDLSDALADAIGFTTQRMTSLGLQLTSRGFEVTTLHLDGGAALSGFDFEGYFPIAGELELGEFDHIEILRGADGLFGGEGSPGATINLIRKRALESPQLSFSVAAGSWDNYRMEVDATGPLGFDGALRGRLDAELLSQHYFYETANRDDAKIFSVLEYDLSPQTWIAIGGSMQWTNARPVSGGLPREGNDSDPHLPLDTALAFDWSKYDADTREIYLQLTQQFDPGWKLKVNATSWSQTYRYDVVTFGTAGAYDVLFPFFQFTPRPNTTNQFAFDTTLTGSFEALGRRVALAVGGDFVRLRALVAFSTPNSFPPMFSLYGFNPSAYPDPQLSNQPVEEDDSTSASDQRALFGSVKVGLTSALSIIGGARISRDSLSAVDVVRVDSFTGSDSARFDEPTKAVPYGGVIYDLSQNFSTYASYAEVYESNGLNVRSANGSFLPPVDSDNLEMGLKGAWRDNTLNSTLAVFGIEQKAIAVEDISAVEANRSQNNGCCFTTSGVIRSKGADLELNGQLTPGWLVGGGYTYNEVYGNQSAAVAGFTPRHLFKLWTSKDLAGIMRGWTVGGKIEAQSAISTPYVPCPSYPQLDCLGELASPLFKTVQGSQAIVGLHVSYAIDSHWRIALNANNIFDRVYYQTLGTPYDADWYGEPRAFTLRIDAKY